MKIDRPQPHSTDHARSQHQVAVIGDGSARGPDPWDRSLHVTLARDAAIIERLARVATATRPVPGADATQIAGLIGELPDTVAAVFLTRTDPLLTRAVQRRVEQAAGRPVLSSEDTTAVALTAGALGYLRRAGRDPHRARVLVAGATVMPILTAILVGTGFPDITMWNSVDGPRFPLSRAARDADVVLDLLPDDPAAAQVALDRPEGSVLSARAPEGAVLAASGLLRALAKHPHDPLDLGVDIYQICATALANATPPRPWRSDPQADPTTAEAVTDAIAAAVARAGGRSGAGAANQWSRDRTVQDEWP